LGPFTDFHFALVIPLLDFGFFGQKFCQSVPLDETKAEYLGIMRQNVASIGCRIQFCTWEFRAFIAEVEPFPGNASIGFTDAPDERAFPLYRAATGTGQIFHLCTRCQQSVHSRGVFFDQVGSTAAAIDAARGNHGYIIVIHGSISYYYYLLF
jgi:hypothetical protein